MDKVDEELIKQNSVENEGIRIGGTAIVLFITLVGGILGIVFARKEMNGTAENIQRILNEIKRTQNVHSNSNIHELQK